MHWECQDSIYIIHTMEKRLIKEGSKVVFVGIAELLLGDKGR